MAVGLHSGLKALLCKRLGASCGLWMVLSTGAAIGLVCLVDPAMAGDPAVSVQPTPFAPVSAPGEKPFTKIAGEKIGVYRPVDFSFKDLWPPFWNGRGVSSGDFDNDGDEDIVLPSTDRGLHLFENTGGGNFTEVDLKIGAYSRLPATIAAFVDLNNDGWLDLYLSGYQAGMFILWNEQGSYSFDRIQAMANRRDAVLADAIAFGDVDQDGDLDVAVGNWASG